MSSEALVGFAAGVKIPPGLTDPVLMMSTDGVGTKLEVAASGRALERGRI